MQNLLRRARDSFNYRRIPSAVRDVDYLWYNAQKKVHLRSIEGFSPLAAATIAEGRTFLREDRLYTLWQGIEQAGEGAVVEVGVYRGGGSAFIARALRHFDRTNPVWAFDTFEGHVVVDLAEDGLQRVGQFADTSYDDVVRYLEPLGVNVVKGNFLEATEVPDTIALAHVDVDVYQVTAHCLDVFGDRLTRGGWIVIDDYGFTSCPGALKAVEEFLARRDDFSRLHLTTGQAVLVRS